MKVGEIIELSIFSGSTVLAGHLGLERNVKYVDSIEVPDFADNWLVPETFLLSTTFAFKEFGEKDLLDLFTAMINANVAAIAIKLGRFIERLPESVIETANEANFPIILLPIDFAYPKAVKEVLGKIVLTEEQHRRYKRKQDLLFHILNHEIDRSEFQNIDWLAADERYKMRVFAAQGTTPDSVETLAALSDKLSGAACDFITYQENKNLSVFFLYKKRSEKAQYSDASFYDKILRKIYQENLLLCSGRNYYFEQIRTSYMEALTALKIARAMGYDQGLFFYEDIEFFANIITKNDRSDVIESSKHLIEPLIRYDIENNTHYFETLKILCSVSFSKAEASKKMHIHRNTLNYRMNMIKKIIQLNNFNDYDQNMKLKLALIIYNFYGDLNSYSLFSQ